MVVTDEAQQPWVVVLYRTSKSCREVIVYPQVVLTQCRCLRVMHNSCGRLYKLRLMTCGWPAVKEKKEKGKGEKAMEKEKRKEKEKEKGKEREEKEKEPEE